jgi:hypothetical protein
VPEHDSSLDCSFDYCHATWLSAAIEKIRSNRKEQWRTGGYVSVLYEGELKQKDGLFVYLIVCEATVRPCSTFCTHIKPARLSRSVLCLRYSCTIVQYSRVRKRVSCFVVFP